MCTRAPSGHAKTKGTIYLSNIRMVFVASKSVGNFFAFDMPLVSNAILEVGSVSVAYIVWSNCKGKSTNLKREEKNYH